MTNEKVIEVFDLYIRALKEKYPNLKPIRYEADTLAPDGGMWLCEHLLWMCDQAKEYVHTNRIDKAMRWLGFTQGALWARGIYTIDELAGHNKPADVEMCKLCHGNKMIDAEGPDGKTPTKVPCPKCVDKPVVSS